jgi:hypothetical protein
MMSNLVENHEILIRQTLWLVYKQLQNLQSFSYKKFSLFEVYISI